MAGKERAWETLGRGSWSQKLVGVAGGGLGSPQALIKLPGPGNDWHTLPCRPLWGQQEAKSWALYLGQSHSRTRDPFDCWTYGQGQAGVGGVLRSDHPSSSDQSDGSRVQAQVSSVFCVAAEPRPLSTRLHY